MRKKKAVKNSGAKSLLVELFTEELPPVSLPLLSQFFADEVFNELVRYQLKLRDFAGRKIFATPRRVATVVPNVFSVTADRPSEVPGPSVNASPDEIAGFARKYGVMVSGLKQRDTPKGKVYIAEVILKGVSLSAVLVNIINNVLKKLPIAKIMRWGDGDAQFVRPVHGLVMLHGSKVVPGKVLGLDSGNRTRGHRYLGKSEITLSNADVYEAKLRDEGFVIADFAVRRAEIERQLLAEAKRLGALLVDYQELLDEVTALVEWPMVYSGTFDKSFLDLPQECLELSMKHHQRYFPLEDKAGKLLQCFLMVSNLDSASPRNIIHGNERVLHARLSDAKFFYDQDLKVRLEQRVPKLASVVYHNKLGSQLERVERIQLLAGKVARQIGADPLLAERAAWLAKADLLTEMVGEFPELQGIMGRYYALHDGEPHEVADAIEVHYRPRFADDHLPNGPIACAVALADKLDTLAGLFGIGQVPTGDKDPFGLRRAALGVIRILIERDLPLSLHELVNAAFAGYNGSVGDARTGSVGGAHIGSVRGAHTNLQEFIFNRLDGYLRDCGYSTLEVESVVSKRPVQINLVPRQVEAVRAFNALPEAQSLAAANKRVVNILKQAEAKGESFINAEADKLQEPAERALFDALKITSQQAASLFNQGDFTGYLKTFAVLKSPVDAFFDSVMVMVEDSKLRQNRLALLADLRTQMNRVADISKLAV